MKNEDFKMARHSLASGLRYVCQIVKSSGALIADVVERHVWPTVCARVRMLEELLRRNVSPKVSLALRVGLLALVLIFASECFTAGFNTGTSAGKKISASNMRRKTKSVSSQTGSSSSTPSGSGMKMKQGVGKFKREQAFRDEEFEKKLANITSERKCHEDGCSISLSANGLQAGVVKRKSGGFNFIVSGTCNGVSNTRLYYTWRGMTRTQDVDWNYDFNYLMLPDENEWTNWMDALKAVHTKVIEWFDVAAKNDIDKMEKEIPIGGIEVLAYNNLITKGKGQRELFLSAIREYMRPDTPVKFFCELSRYVYQKGKGEYSGRIVVRCGYFEQVILRFSGDKTRINNDILLMIERYDPAALKKAFLDQVRKQDMFK